MHTTIKALTWNKLLEVHKLFANANNDRKSTDIVYDQIKYKDVEITFYKNQTVYIKGHLSDDIKSKLLTLLDRNLYIGVDEVGVGETIGPVVACACWFDNIKDKEKALFINIKDSKKMNLNEITEVADKIKKLAKYECKIIEPKKFNELQEQLQNSKAINAILINNILTNVPTKDEIIIDAFATKGNYLKYIKDAGIKVTRDDLTFVEKSEEKYLEVAAAAILSKKAFNDWVIDYCKKNNIKLELKNNINTYKIFSELKDKDKHDNLIKKWRA